MSLKKITKGFSFELEIQTSNRRQDILYTLQGDEIVNVKIGSLSLYKPTMFPSPETQRMFNEAFTKNFSLSFESWTVDRKTV